MRAAKSTLLGSIVCLAIASLLVGCSGDSGAPAGTGGSDAAAGAPGNNLGDGGKTTGPGSGGATSISSSGGANAGGSSSALGGASGGDASTSRGGSSSTPAGGTATGGTATGGTANGGTATGGRSAIGGTTSTTSTATGGRSAIGGTTSTATGGTTSTATGGTATGGTATGGTASTGTHSGKWKVMLLGDSITASTCYPQLVSKELISAGHTNFELVGTQTNTQSCGATSVKEEGHGGYGVTYLPQDSTRSACTKSSGCGSYSELQSWAALKPEIVLMHYGTNDVWDGQSSSSILSAYVSVINEFRKQNPSVIFFVSKIIKLSPSGCSNCLTNVGGLAAALTDNWASSNSTATSPIHIVDNYNSGFDPTNSGDTTDGVHPTAAGALKSAKVTAAAVIAENYF